METTITRPGCRRTCYRRGWYGPELAKSVVTPLKSNMKTVNNPSGYVSLVQNTSKDNGMATMSSSLGKGGLMEESMQDDAMYNENSGMLSGTHKTVTDGVWDSFGDNLDEF